MKVRYNNRKLRLTAASVASFYMLFHGRPFDLVKAFTSPLFYLALVVSYSIAILLVQYIHYVTQWLDRQCGWRQMPAERSVLQFTLGVIFPSIIDLLLISVYFNFKGENAIDNGFLLIDFPVIVLLVFVWNAYYLVHYLLLTEKEMHRQSSTGPDTDTVDGNESIPQKLDVLKITYWGKEHKFRMQEILFFYRTRKEVRFITQDGSDYFVKHSLADLAERYTLNDFSQINRSVMINFKLIDKYLQGRKRDTLDLTTKKKYAAAINKIGRNNFQVTKEHIVAFKTKYEAWITQK